MLKFIKIVAVAAVFSFSIASAAVQTADEEVPVKEATKSLQKTSKEVFPIGSPNVNYAKYFTGKSYLYPMASGNGINVANVTIIGTFITEVVRFSSASAELAGIRFGVKSRLR